MQAWSVYPLSRLLSHGESFEAENVCFKARLGCVTTQSHHAKSQSGLLCLSIGFALEYLTRWGIGPSKGQAGVSQAMLAVQEGMVTSLKDNSVASLLLSGKLDRYLDQTLLVSPLVLPVLRPPRIGSDIPLAAVCCTSHVAVRCTVWSGANS